MKSSKISAVVWRSHWGVSAQSRQQLATHTMSTPDHDGAVRLNLNCVSMLYDSLTAGCRTNKFEDHWKALGTSDQDRSRFSWNPDGIQLHDCVLPINLDGSPLILPSTTGCRSHLSASHYVVAYADYYQ
jgi:hypothetical protein